MALADILTERVARRGQTAHITCRELGTMTVEALPAGDLTALLRGADGRRAVVYAACRELQTTGEALRKTGRLFQPDEIMTFLAEDEVQTAFQAVLDLSGAANSPQFFSQTSEESEHNATAGQEALPVGGPPAPEAPSPQSEPVQQPTAAISNLPAQEGSTVDKETTSPSVQEGTAAENDAVQSPVQESGAAERKTEQSPARESGAAEREASIPPAKAHFDHFSPQAVPLPERNSRPIVSGEALSRRQDSAAIQGGTLVPYPIPGSFKTDTGLDEDALTERVARRILAGLRQAAAVR